MATSNGNEAENNDTLFFQMQEGTFLQQERAEALRVAIATLSEEHRAVLVLSHYEGLT